MDLKAAVPPPEYRTTTDRPPSYHGGQPGAPEIIVSDEKVRPAEENHPAHRNAPAVGRPTSVRAAPVSSSSTTLQYFSRKLPHPDASAIPKGSWDAFVRDLRAAVAPTGGQKTVAILAGAGLWIGTGFLPIGLVVSGLMWRHAVKKHVIEDLTAPEGAANERSGAPSRKTIRQVVDHYNAQWQPLGVQVRIDEAPKIPSLETGPCQCQKEIVYRPGCGGKMVPYINGRRADSCCARRCQTCGQWQGGRAGRRHQKHRKYGVQVTVERLEGATQNSQPRLVPTAPAAPAKRDMDEVSEKLGWVKVDEAS